MFTDNETPTEWCQLNALQATAVMHLTHWGRVTHICISKLTIIGSDNGLSPGRRQAIICTNAGILLIRTLGTNFSEILCEIHSFSFSKMHLKMPSAKWHPFCLGVNVLMTPLSCVSFSTNTKPSVPLSVLSTCCGGWQYHCHVTRRQLSQLFLKNIYNNTRDNRLLFQLLYKKSLATKSPFWGQHYAICTHTQTDPGNDNTQVKIMMFQWVSFWDQTW